MINKDTTLQDYLDSIYVISHSYSTIGTYRLSIVNKNKVGFRDFIEQKYGIDEIKLVEKIKKDELDPYVILKEFVIFLDKNGYTSKSIQTRMASVKGYLRHLGIKIYSEDFKFSVRLPKTIRQREEPITRAIIVRILKHLPPKLQTVVVILSASGMRIGELVQLKLSDIDFSTIPTMIKIRAETTKTKQSRDTFLTEEATSMLKDYLKRYFGWVEGERNGHLKDKNIFGRTSKVKSKIKNTGKQPTHLLESATLMKSLANYLEKVPELNQKNPNGRKQIHFHALRKFFRTTVGNVCGRDFAEAIIGHGFYMDTYYTLSTEDRCKLYQKAEPYLTISDFTKIERSLEAISEKQKEIDERLTNVERNKLSVPNNLIINKQ
ncbi:MAG: tyrosine-type recombinase/integrase [Thaumarchaeota archaeon]|nr:tyrosine-type recombinase/integrase [Nitrososphaerota archaeon]